MVLYDVSLRTHSVRREQQRANVYAFVALFVECVNEWRLTDVLRDLNFGYGSISGGLCKKQATAFLVYNISDIGRGRLSPIP